MPFFDALWSGLNENSSGFNVIVNTLMLLVWVFYFQLLWVSFRRQRRAKILINRSAGHGLDAKCVVSNMSEGAVYLQALVLEVPDADDTRSCSLTDLDNLTVQPEGDPRTFWFQGPIGSGEFLTLGTFRELLRICSNGTGIPIDDIERFNIVAVATYGPDDAPVAARRSFSYGEDSAEGKRWKAGAVRQIRGYFERRGLRKYLRDSGSADD